MEMEASELAGNGQLLEAPDDAVHVEQAAKALEVSRRTVERMIERGELERDSLHGGAAVTKRSLVEALDERRGTTRRRVAASHELAPLLEAVTQLTETLAAERRQLTAATEERRAAERGWEGARIEAARAEAELHAERTRLEAARRATDERLQRIATAGFFERRQLLRELRGGASR